MTNQYYVKPADLEPGTKARSSDINALTASVENAFDKVPDSMAMKTGTLNYATDTGTTPNVYVVALDAAIVDYTDGLVVRMRPTRANTGACSINVNGLGAVAIKRTDGTDMQADDIGVNLPVELSYVESSNTFVSVVVVTSQVKQVATQATNAAASATAASQSASAAATSAARATELANMPVRIGLRNRIVNGNFAINQRAVSGTIVLAAGAYGHDMWKAGAAGCTYTFASNGIDTTITITAGTLIQVIDGQNVEGGVYTMTRSGSAPARIGINGATPSGAYAAAPITTASATAGQAIRVEFSAGTIGLVQVEQSTPATPFERRPVSMELAMCQRYYRRWSVPSGFMPIATGFSYSATAAAFTLVCGEMRGTPLLQYSNICCFTSTGVQIAADASLSNYNSGMAHLTAISASMSVGQGNQICVGSNNGQPGSLSLSSEL